MPILQFYNLFNNINLIYRIVKSMQVSQTVAGWIHKPGARALIEVVACFKASCTSMETCIHSTTFPETMAADSRETCRLFIENTGQRGWFKPENPYQAHVQLGVYVNGVKTGQLPIREDTHPGERIHFSFHLYSPVVSGSIRLTLKLLGEHFGFRDAQGVPVLERTVAVTDPAG